MCDGLFKSYPPEGMTGPELAQKHFPEAISRTGTHIETGRTGDEV